MFIFRFFSNAYATLSRSVENLNTRLLARCVLLCAVVAGLGGCSLARIGYEALPTLLQWEIDRYVDLDDAQRAIVSRHLEQVLRWHRSAELPQYARFLRGVDERVRGQVDTGEVARMRERVDDAWSALSERLAPGLVELAFSLRPEQLARMGKRVDETQRKARERFVPGDGESREEARAKRVLKRVEFFLGDLPSAQAAEVRRLAASLPSAEDAWLAEREARQRQLIAMLDRLRTERPPIAAATRIAREHLQTMWESRDQARRQRLSESIAASDALTARLVERADAGQRRHLSKLLRGYAEDFEALAAKVQTASSAN